MFGCYFLKITGTLSNNKAPEEGEVCVYIIMRNSAGSFFFIYKLADTTLLVLFFRRVYLQVRYDKYVGNTAINSLNCCLPHEYYTMVTVYTYKKSNTLCCSRSATYHMRRGDTRTHTKTHTKTQHTRDSTAVNAPSKRHYLMLSDS